MNYYNKSEVLTTQNWTWWKNYIWVIIVSEKQWDADTHTHAHTHTHTKDHNKTAELVILNSLDLVSDLVTSTDLTILQVPINVTFDQWCSLCGNVILILDRQCPNSCCFPGPIIPCQQAMVWNNHTTYWNIIIWKRKIKIKRNRFFFRWQNFVFRFLKLLLNTRTWIWKWLRLFIC